MSTIVSEFTTQLTNSSSMPGVIAVGLLIALLIEIEILRAFKQKVDQPGIRVLAIAIIPLSLVFMTWMAARIYDLVY